MSSPAYDIHNLKQCYSGKEVLSLDQLIVPRGSILGLMGPNGSGKSTLLRLLALIEKPSQGGLMVMGRDASQNRRLLRREVSLLLQEASLLKRSVFKNVAYGLKLRKDLQDLARRVEQALCWVGLDPAEFRHRSWRELSGGEAQRVALAARLILRPQVLLLDEPTASLDMASAGLILDAALMARREWGATLVVASHDLAWLHAVADQVLALHKGRPQPADTAALLTGPWHRAEPGGHWQAEMAPGQRVLLADGPQAHRDGVVQVRGGDIRFSLDRPEAGEVNLLEGEVSQIGLDSADGGFMLRIMVGRASFIIRLAAGCPRLEGLLPGRACWLSFSEKSPRWI